MRVFLTNNRDPDDGREYWSLTIGRESEVIGIEANSYRIVDDTGDPVLFNPACFRVTDAAEHPFWQISHGPDGEEYAYPPSWGEPGFFEDYHDGSEVVQTRFWQEYRVYFGEPRPITKPSDAWKTIRQSQDRDKQ